LFARAIGGASDEPPRPLADHHTFGWTGWLAHVTISAFMHALIFSTVFRLMHHATLGHAMVLVAVMLARPFMWARDRRGW